MTKIRLKSTNVEGTFAEWLKDARKKSYLSMDALGKQVGVSKQYISVLERGGDHPLTNKPVTPKREVVEAIAKVTGADLNEGLRRAGYSIDINIPDDIILESYDGFSQEDIDKIVSYIRFVREEKKKNL